jgi:hypothetical protein
MNPIGKVRPYSLCIRMSSCERFETHYLSGRSLLHIGIADSRCLVYHFDEHGLHLDGPESWNDICVCIELPLNENHIAVFDFVLDEYFEAFRGRKRKYHAFDENCYDFVVGFLNTLNFQGRADHSKEEIVENFIKGPISQLEEYLLLKTSRRICDICQGVISYSDSFYHCLECKDFDVCDLCFKKNSIMDKKQHHKEHELRYIERKSN